MQSILLKTVDVFFQVIYLLIFVRILLSWVNLGRNSTIGNMIYALTEPILGPVRAMLDKSPIGGGMMLDFSPVIALFIMNIVKMVIISIIYVL